MDVIGTGFRTVGDRLIVRLSSVPEINTKVYSETGDEIGKLVDIIGPVKSPFGVVMSKEGEAHQGRMIMVK